MLTFPLRPLYPHRLFTTRCSSLPLRPWRGLDAWRSAPPSSLLRWGPAGPIPVEPNSDSVEPGSSLAELGVVVLATSDPLEKARLSHLAFATWWSRRGEMEVGRAEPPDRPARPDKPVLVSTKEVPSPKRSGLPLNAYLLHSLAHVELNAVDLAWDTVARFSGLRGGALGDGFFADFARVAADEGRHFGWCAQRLVELGFEYGDMPAHNLLWRECERTAGDVSARLAVIPLVQEARGLDAGPRLVQKLIGCGDKRSAEIVARIAQEELAHVAVGVHWFDFICKKLRRIPCNTFNDLLEEYGVELKGPFNYSARDEAGIPRHWYDKSMKPEVTGALSEVHDRLSYIVSMEKENSSLNG